MRGFNSNDNYPPGAMNDPNAPWNQDKDTVEVSVTATSTWKRNEEVECPICVDIDEDGKYAWADTENIQNDFVYEYMSMENLMDEFKVILGELIKSTEDKRQLGKYHRLLEEINAWEETDFEVEEDN